MGCLTVKTKELLIDEYRKLKMYDINGFTEAIKNLEIYLSENGSDAQLELALHMARARKIDYLGMDRESIFDGAKPALELLQTIGDSFFEIESIATMLCYIKSDELGKRLMRKALNALDTNLADHERCEATKLIIFCNMTYRLLYSRFYDNEDPKDVETLFNHCTKSGVTLCEKMGADALVLRTSLLIRQAVFYENFEEIPATLEALKALDNEAVFKSMKDEISEFYHKMDTAPPTAIINLFMGHQIRTRRVEIGLSKEELAVRIGIDADSLKTVESGGRGLRMTNFMACAKALNIDYNYMLGNLSKHPKIASEDPFMIQLHAVASALSKRGQALLLETAKNIVKFDTTTQPPKSTSKTRKKR